MKFTLYSRSTDGARVAIAEDELPHRAAAIEWARNQVRDKDGNYGYELISDNGTFAAMLVRTAGGQWYGIGQSPPL